MGRIKAKEQGAATNLWLTSFAKTSGSAIAKTHYDNRSLSWLVEKLLRAEAKRRKVAQAK